MNTGLQTLSRAKYSMEVSTSVFRSIVSSFNAPIKFAFSYGSGVFFQRESVNRVHHFLLVECGKENA